MKGDISMPRYIIFDLDGTLTDSGEGIINCASLALRHFGLPVPDRQTMGAFVGPPLRKTFIKFGVPEEKAEEAVAVYRSRYMTIGKYENTPYEGILQVLEELKKRGYSLYVATAKPEEMAVDILHKFGLAPYFDKICGASMDASRDTKALILAYLLEQLPPRREGDTIMVGDTAFDVVGAAAHGIPTVGVSWGYGSACELKEAGAVCILSKPQDLLTYFN